VVALLLDAEPLFWESHGLLKNDWILQLRLVLCKPLQVNDQDSRKHHQLRLDVSLRLAAAGRASVLILSVKTLILEEFFHAVHQIYWLGLLRLGTLVNKVGIHFYMLGATGSLARMLGLTGGSGLDVLLC
jgi:hypothetical protein